MDRYENEVIILRLMLDGRHNNARAMVKTLPKEQLLKLSDTLDYYAVLVDDQLIRGDKRS